jgi:hypothetical protein
MSHTASLQNDARYTGYGVAIAVDAIMLYVVHHLVEWGVPFITPAFADVVWAFDLSLGTSIAVNALLMLSDRPWWRHVGDVAREATALIATYVLYQVFPFDLPSALAATLAGLVLPLIMLILVISIVVHTVQAITDGAAELAAT